MGLIILDINNILNTFEKSLYTWPLMILLNIVFLVVAFRNRSKEKWTRLFIVYGIAALLQGFLTGFLSFAKKILFKDTPTLTLANEYSIIIFILIELIIFYTLFYFLFSQKRVKNMILITGKIFGVTSGLISLCIFFFASPTTLTLFEGYLSVTASILLLIPSFYYFYTLFTTPPDKNLLYEPFFWIITGIAFINSLNIPVFLLYNFFIKEYTLYSINYAAYCILFILFIISLLCNKKQKSVSTRLNYYTH